MFTLKKIWDIFNYSGKAWQLSLACSFSIVLAFQPSFTLISLVVLLLVLLLNVHLSLFIFLSGVLKIVGMILDGLFDKIGNSLLSSSSFSNLFEAIQNSAILKWFGFNNSIILGSFIVSIILAILVFPIVIAVLKIYREKIAVAIANIPILNKINYFKKEEEKASFLRLAGFIPIVLIFALVTVFADSVIKSVIENEFAAATDKKLKIEKLHISFLNSNIVMNNLEVLDKESKTTIENIAFDFNLEKALLKKIYIEKLEAKNIKTENSKSSVENKEASSNKKSSEQSSIVDKNLDLTNLNVDTKSFDKAIVSEYRAKFDEYKGYYKKLVPYIKKQKSEKQDIKRVIKRADGTWYYFNDITNLPDFVIENARLSYIIEKEKADINIKDLSSDQDLYKKPILVSVKYDSKKVGFIESDSILVHNENKDLDTVNFQIKGFKKDVIEKDIIKFENSSISTMGKVIISNLDKVSSNININFDKTSLVLSDKIKVSKYLNPYLKDIENLNLKIEASDEKNIHLKSNLDKVLSNASKKALKANESKIKDKIIDKVEDKLKDKINVKELKNLFKF